MIHLIMVMIKKHMNEVIEKATELAKKHCPEKMRAVQIAALLHDIGLSISRENHATRWCKDYIKR